MKTSFSTHYICFIPLHTHYHLLSSTLITSLTLPFISLLRIHFYALPTSNIIWNFEKIIWKLQIYFWKFQIFFCNFQTKTQYSNTINWIRRSDINVHERHINMTMTPRFRLWNIEALPQKTKTEHPIGDSCFI